MSTVSSTKAWAAVGASDLEEPAIERGPLRLMLAAVCLFIGLALWLPPMVAENLWAIIAHDGLPQHQDTLLRLAGALTMTQAAKVGLFAAGFVASVACAVAAPSSGWRSAGVVAALLNAATLAMMFAGYLLG